MKRRIMVLSLSMALAISSLIGCGQAEPDAVSTEYSGDYEWDMGLTPGNRGASEAQTEICYDYDDIIHDLAMGETYTVNDENGFKNVIKYPLSTFAADVDTASYSNMRRFVNNGYNLYSFPEGSIRVEEMVNYFSYDYAKPKNGEVFGVNATISDCPWNRESKLMILGINTDKIEEEERPASNIVFLVDISGSMDTYNKLPLLISSMSLLADNLTENDRISIVTYANGTEVVLDGITGDKTGKTINAFEQLTAGGGTNGEGGIDLAYKIAEKHFIEGGNNRVILGTDGDFNIGKYTRYELEELISQKKETGVFLSVLGFGMDNYSDTTAETLADAGNGNYSYIDNLNEAKKVLVDEMSSTIYTVAKDTKFQVEFNPALVEEYRLVGYENRMLATQDFKDDTKDGGELGAGHQVTAIYEIKPANEYGGSQLKYQNSAISKKGQVSDEWCTLSIAYKEPESEASKYFEYPIGVDNYTQMPSEDFIFATSVAEYAMALTNSEYLVNMSREEALEQAIKNVSKLNPEDELRAEFLELMETVAGRVNY